MTLLPACLCGSTEAEETHAHGLTVRRCPCGVKRQSPDMSDLEYAAWYGERYHAGIYYHTAEQDREVARLRLREYGEITGRLLDVGSGNGAFVAEALAQGIDAWGQDLAQQSDGPRVYAEPLHDVHFPSCHFSTVTMHDVLEHWPDPKAALAECHRILEDGGELIVDFPRFHHPAGAHHWKPVEHLWLLDDDQLATLIRQSGFLVQDIRHPVESKTVVYAHKVPNPKVRMLVPPGIGDGWWVASKIPALREQLSIPTLEVVVHDSGPRRSEEFWRSLPWVEFGGHVAVNDTAATRRAYQTPDHPVQTNVAGCDLFVSLNGTMDSGVHPDEAIPGTTAWNLPLFRSKAERAKEAEYAELGPYVVLGYWGRGFYRDRWLPAWGLTKMLHTARQLMSRGFKVVATGADWDRRDIISDLCQRDRRIIDMVGKTSFSDLVALVRSSSGVLGYPAGSTMLGGFLGRPTVLLWADKFPEAMWWNALPPSDEYLPMDVRAAPNDVVDTLISLMQR